MAVLVYWSLHSFMISPWQQIYIFKPGARPQPAFCAKISSHNIKGEGSACYVIVVHKFDSMVKHCLSWVTVM